MLYFIVVWTFLIIVCYLIGTALLNVLTADSIERVGDRLIVAIWLGIVVLSISLLATSLFLPLSPLVGAVITVIISSLSLLSQRTRTELVTLWFVLSPDLILGFFTLELAVATFTTRQVNWIDTGLYHYGVIRWLSEFGAVPGLALLLSNLGFTSSWFALAAPLNAEIFDSRVSAVTNGFAFLVTVLHFLICLAQLFTNKIRISDWLVIISSLITLPIVVVSNLMSAILVSPSPDLPVLFLIQVVAWLILIISNPVAPSVHKIEARILNYQIIPLLLSAGAATMKLIALPLLFISGLFYIFNRGLSVQRALISSAMIVLLLSPMLTFGVITSGCPLYPSSFLCLDLPWSVAAQEAKRVVESTHKWGTWYDSVGTSSGFWLLWKWFSSDKLNQVMASLTLLSTLCSIYIVRTLTTSRIRGQLWLIALAVLGITFLMFTAPSFRFGLGYLMILPALSSAIYCQAKVGKILPTLVYKFTSYYRFRKLRKVVLAFPLFYTALTIVILFNNGIQYRLLLPPQLPRVELLPRQVNDVRYFLPKPISLCWAAKLPCAFERTNIKLRNPAYGIKAGFVRDK